MRHSLFILTLSSLLVSPIAAIAQSPAIAPLSLTQSIITSAASTPLAQFTITLPAGSGQRFARLSLTDQQIGTGVAPVAFDLPATRVFLGRDSSAPAVSTQAWIDETGTLWIELDPTVPPQTSLTIALSVKPSLNPASDRARTYGIAAYPAISRPVAVFVGDVGLTLP
jgi:hypothetical protein